MPFYEYECNACGHRLEALQKIADEALKFCPECGDASLKKLISRAGFRLKGGGWYETDFKHGGKQKDGDKKDAKPDGKPAEKKKKKESVEATAS